MYDFGPGKMPYRNTKYVTTTRNIILELVEWPSLFVKWCEIRKHTLQSLRILFIDHLRA